MTSAALERAGEDAMSQVWNSVVTNGIFVRFGNVELSHDEILSMAEQEYRDTTY